MGLVRQFRATKASEAGPSHCQKELETSRAQLGSLRLTDSATIIIQAWRVERRPARGISSTGHLPTLLQARPDPWGQVGLLCCEGAGTTEMGSGGRKSCVAPWLLPPTRGPWDFPQPGRHKGNITTTALRWPHTILRSLATASVYGGIVIRKASVRAGFHLLLGCRWQS